ncbi:MAG: sigma-70 family RNA polymerase sigma factor [Acidobacteriota bacterium]
MDASDLTVVAQVRAGDHDAFRVLVERYSQPVFRVAYRVTGHEQDAEDVVQETFLRAYRQIGQFQERAAFSTWLYRIAFNCAHDLLRQRPNHQRLRSLDDGGAGLALEPADGSADANPHRKLADTEFTGKLQDAFRDLSLQERAAFMLRHFEGLSIEEIGKVLGLRQSATKHSVFRAVRKLRLSMEPLYGGES